MVFRSRAVFGPYEPGPVEPILTQRQLDPARPFPVWTTGHADFVETQSGEWWAVFLGTRPYEDYTFNTGRETFLLPVRWQDGWPVILSGNETVPYVVRAPDLPPDPDAVSAAERQLLGPRRLRRAAARPDLDLPAHRPRAVVAETTSHPGLADTRRAARRRSRGLGQPSFVARRQQHAWATATAAMRYRPLVPGDKAGIVAFQGSDAFYFLGVTLGDGTAGHRAGAALGATRLGDHGGRRLDAPRPLHPTRPCTCGFARAAGATTSPTRTARTPGCC